MVLHVATPPGPPFPLLKLPPELLLHIVTRELHHEDFESIVLSCRAIFDLTDSVRARHLERKKQYSEIVCGDARSIDDRDNGQSPRLVHPILILRSLLSEDGLDEMEGYCKKLALGATKEDQFLTSSYDGPTIEEARNTKRDLVPILRTLVDSHRFTSINLDQWIDPLWDGNCHLPYILLLVSLARVRTLELTCCSYFIIERLLPFSELWEPSLNEGHHTLLGELEDVTLHEVPDVNYNNIHALCCFARLPTVQSVRGHGITTGTMSLLESSCDHGWSTVERIRFQKSCVDEDGLKHILHGIQALRALYLEHTDEYIDSYYDPKSNVDVLQRYASNTLESLTIIADHFHPVDYVSQAAFDGRDLDATGSLGGFKLLKDAALDAHIFLASTEVRDETLPILGKYMQKQRMDIHMARLVDKLPQSIETLELWGIRKLYDTKALFRGFAELRKERVPKLQKITFVGHVARFKAEAMVGAEIRDMCSTFGIDLAFEDCIVFNIH
ncbi:MAG: hypothetical protein Q9222_004174 [Ikaeria aurantiellina]